MVRVRERSNVSHGHSLEDAFQSFLNARSADGVRERTKKDYHAHWRYFNEFLQLKHADILTIEQLSPTLIREYVNYQQFDKVQYEDETDRKKHPQGLSVTTINIRLRTLKAMCRFWYLENMLPEDIGKNIHQLKFDDDKKRTFSDHEIVKLLNVFNLRLYNDWRDYCLIRLLIDSGARINETCNIAPEDISFERKSVYLTADVVKSRHGREVPLSDSVLKDLHDLIKENKEYFGNPQFVFLTTVGKQYQPSAFRHRLRVAAEKAGIGRATPHMFRHYMISKFALHGDIFSLQRIVDHKNIQTTRRYVTYSQDEVARQHSKFSPIKDIDKLENKRSESK